MNARVPVQTCRGVDLDQVCQFAEVLAAAELAWADVDGRYRAGFVDERERDLGHEDVVAELAHHLGPLAGLTWSGAWSMARLLLASKAAVR